MKKTLPGPKAKALLAKDGKYISPSYTRSYPAVVCRGRGANIWDVDGNLFLDFNAGVAVCSTGHCHPEVVKAIQKQAAELIHMSGTDFYYPSQINLAEKIASIFPSGPSAKSFFANSGAEAVEAAMKLSRYYTGRQKFISFYGAFHGRTFGALSLTASKYTQKKGFGTLLAGVEHAHYAYCYRCPFNLKYPGCSLACADYIENILLKKTMPPEEVAAIVVEPFQGEGGYVVPPADWLPRIHKIAQKYGMLLVCDEIQAGMGRTGKMFACEHFGVKPDIITIAKGVASGLPLGIMVAKSSIMIWKPGAHASTFGGNPVACESALATLKLIQNGLMENARVQGEYFKQQLLELQKEFEVIGDVRGKGLMLAIELVEDRHSKKPACELRNKIVDDECFKRGLLLLGCGASTIRFCPPLVVTRKEIDSALDILREAMRSCVK